MSFFFFFFLEEVIILVLIDSEDYVNRTFFSFVNLTLSCQGTCLCLNSSALMIFVDHVKFNKILFFFFFLSLCVVQQQFGLHLLEV